MALLWLTACSQSEKDNTDKKESNAPVETPAAGGLFGNGYSAASYRYGNSTNLYKDFIDLDPAAEEASAEEAAFAQYDLEGKHVQDIALVGEAYELLSVDDSWLYYAVWRKARDEEQIVICRLPVTKQDGGDVVDTSKEEILLAPDHVSNEEKELGIKEKDYESGGACYITSKYLICIVEADVGKEMNECEIIRYDLQTKEFSYDLYGDGDSDYSEFFYSGYVFGSGDMIVLCGADGVFLLEVDSLAVSQLSDVDCEEEPSHVLLTADSNTFCYLTESYDESADTEITIYSLANKCLHTVIAPEELKRAVCEAEESGEDAVYNTAYDLLGSYRDKIYLRYLFEQEQGSSYRAHYGVLSLSLSDCKFSYEKEISEAVQRESVPFHGQWIRYQKLSKQEKKAAKKEGRKPEKSIDEQYELTVNLGNPQRVIGNQLFFRSINQNMEKNGWYVYCLDTNNYEKLTAEDPRNEWIYLQNSYGWDEDIYLSATKEILCIDDYDYDDLVEVVWDAPQTEASETEGAAAGSGQAVSEREQLQYMAAHRYDWLRYILDGTGDLIDSCDEWEIGSLLDHVNYESGLKYIVTDLNQNGRLEVIALNQAGTGAFTYMRAYEYSYKTQSLGSVSSPDHEEWWSVPDIGGVKKTDVYYDKKHKMHWYFGTDFLHASGEENYNSLCLWGIDGEGVYRESLGAYSEFSYDKNKPVHYYIGDDEASKEAFKKKKKNMEPGMKRGKATLGWQRDGQALVVMSEEELLEKLTKSWEGFSVKY